MSLLCGKTRSRAGNILLSLMVAFTISSIALSAFISFVGGTSNSIARTNEFGAKEDLRVYLRQRIDCEQLETHYGACLNGSAIEVFDTFGNVLIPILSATDASSPTSMTPTIPSTILPFAIRATCNTSSGAPSRYQIEVMPIREIAAATGWKALYPELAPCL